MKTQIEIECMKEKIAKDIYELSELMAGMDKDYLFRDKLRQLGMWQAQYNILLEILK